MPHDSQRVPTRAPRTPLASVTRGPSCRLHGTPEGASTEGSVRAAVIGLLAVLVALAGFVALGGADRLFGSQEPVLDSVPKDLGGESSVPAASPGASRVSPSATGGAEAASMLPKEPNAHDKNEAAVGALADKDFDRAIDLLIDAMTERPDIDVFSGNLAEAYLQRAKFREGAEPLDAASDYERAIQLTGDEGRRAQIERLRDRARAIGEREADFTIESTLHFTFRFDGARQEILGGIDELKGMLESTYQEYGDLFGRRPVEEGEPRIEVVFYRSEGFNAVTGLGDWAGGVFDGTIRVPADDLRAPGRVARLQEVLRHEVAHAFTRSIGGTRVPSWLNEGLAQWLESPATRSAEVRIARGRLGASGTGLFPLSELQGTLAQWKDRAKISRAYDQALAFTGYLIDQYGAELAFQMVAGCKTAGPEGAAAVFLSTILVDLDLVLADFRDSLAR